MKPEHASLNPNVAIPRWYSSMKVCAATRGIPLAVLKQFKAEGKPCFDRAGRVDLEGVIRFLFDAVKEASELPEGFANWHDVLNQKRALREELRLEKEKKKVMDFDEAKRQVREGVGFLFSELERAERELPPVLKGLSEIEIQEKLARSHSDIKANARAKFDVVGEQT